MKGDVILSVENLEVSYGRILALRGVSFDVRAGQIAAVVGANGAGKTTLLGAISGLLKPRHGQIRFAGRDLTGRPSHEIVARGIIQVPEGRAILATMSVEENLELGAFARAGLSNASQRVDDMMRRFPILLERRHVLAGSLSGGEQQMLAMARGLLQGPELLLLDEPSMGLAPKLVNEIFQIIREIHDQGNNYPPSRTECAQSALPGRPGVRAGARSNHTGRQRGRSPG